MPDAETVRHFLHRHQELIAALLVSVALPTGTVKEKRPRSRGLFLVVPEQRQQKNDR
jgi:hypothetical protein